MIRANSEQIDQVSPDLQDDEQLRLRPFRRFLVVGISAAFAYGFATNARNAYCSDPPSVSGTEGDGGFCIELSLSPSPVVFVVLALLAVLVANRAIDAASASNAARIAWRGSIVAVAVAAGSTIISQVWFWAIPVSEFRSGTFSYFSPLPFGIVSSLFSDGPLLH